MKLSIIVPIYKEASKVKRILKKLDDQTSKKFEVVLVVDTNGDNTLGIVDEYSESFGKRMKVVYNSKRVGRTSALYGGINAATSTYSMILDTSDKFNNKMVENVLKSLEGKSADIIEYKISFMSPIKIETKMRHVVKEKTKIEEDRKIIAYASFFDFNKVYKTSLLKKVTLMPKFNNQLNSRFSTEISYKALLHAKTYQTVSKAFVSSYSKLSSNYNPLRSIRQFNEIIEWSTLRGHDYEPELEYAMFIYMTLFLFAFTGASKNKVLLKKMGVLYNKQLETRFVDFKDTNQYILDNNKETLILRKKHSINTLTKIYKEFK